MENDRERPDIRGGEEKERRAFVQPANEHSLSSRLTDPIEKLPGRKRDYASRLYVRDLLCFRRQPSECRAETHKADATYVGQGWDAFEHFGATLDWFRFGAKTF